MLASCPAAATPASNRSARGPQDEQRARRSPRCHASSWRPSRPSWQSRWPRMLKLDLVPLTVDGVHLAANSTGYSPIVQSPTHALTRSQNAG